MTIKFIKNDKIELFIWVLFSIIIIISDYIKNSESEICNPNTLIKRDTLIKPDTPTTQNTEWNYNNNIGYSGPDNSGLGSIITNQYTSVDNA